MNRPGKLLPFQRVYGLMPGKFTVCRSHFSVTATRLPLTLTAPGCEAFAQKLTV